MNDHLNYDVWACAATVLDALAEAGINGALGGGLAYIVWSQTRATLDVDLNVFVKPSQYPLVLETLESVGCKPGREEVWNQAARDNFLSRAGEGDVAMVWLNQIRVDIFVPSIPFYEEANRTLCMKAFPDGRERAVLSAEALCVFKLLFFRPKDKFDLRTLVTVRGTELDVGWVREQIVGMLGEDDEHTEFWDLIVREQLG